MRLFIFNCLLLASVAIASQNERHKRDLTYLKNLIKSTIFGRNQINLQPPPVLQENNGYKLYPFIPGYDDIMFKVAPKKAVVEEFVYPQAIKQGKLNAFGSVVGTKSKDDTLVAVNGILYGRHKNNVMKETVHPTFPPLNTSKYVVEEKMKTAPVTATRPIFTEFMERRPVVKEVIETKPVRTEAIRPLNEKVEVKVLFAPYLYKQMQNNELYTGHTKPGVELLETVQTKSELPMCIKKRVDGTIVLCADPNLLAPVQEEFQYRNPPVIDFSYPSVDENRFSPVQEEIQYQSPSVVDFSYLMEEANSFIESADSNRFVPVQEEYQYRNSPVVDVSDPRVEANSLIKMVDDKRFATVQEEILYQSPPVVDYSYPREVNSFESADSNRFASVQEVYEHQTAPVMDFSYPREDTNLYGQNSFREEVCAEGFETVAEKAKHLKDNPVRYNLRPMRTQAINPRPVPLHSHESLHFEKDIGVSKDKVNSETTKVAFTSSGEKVNMDQTLGPVPPQYITHVNYKNGEDAVSDEKIMKQMKAVPIVGSKDNVANAKIPINVYKLQINPNTGEVQKKLAL